AVSTINMPTIIAISDVRSRVVMQAKVTHVAARGQSCLYRASCGARLNQLSEDSYKQRGPLARASQKLKLAASYFGADEEESPVDFFDFLLWCAFLCVELLAGADELLSEAGGVVSAANTGPASRSRLRSGTSFLNIELASETGWIHNARG